MKTTTCMKKGKKKTVEYCSSTWEVQENFSGILSVCDDCLGKVFQFALWRIEDFCSIRLVSLEFKKIADQNIKHLCFRKYMFPFEAAVRSIFSIPSFCVNISGLVLESADFGIFEERSFVDFFKSFVNLSFIHIHGNFINLNKEILNHFSKKLESIKIDLRMRKREDKVKNNYLFIDFDYIPISVKEINLTFSVSKMFKNAGTFKDLKKLEKLSVCCDELDLYSSSKYFLCTNLLVQSSTKNLLSLILMNVIIEEKFWKLFNNTRVKNLELYRLTLSDKLLLNFPSSLVRIVLFDVKELSNLGIRYLQEVPLKKMVLKYLNVDFDCFEYLPSTIEKLSFWQKKCKIFTEDYFPLVKFFNMSLKSLRLCGSGICNEILKYIPKRLKKLSLDDCSEITSLENLKVLGLQKFWISGMPGCVKILNNENEQKEKMKTMDTLSSVWFYNMQYSTIFPGRVFQFLLSPKLVTLHISCSRIVNMKFLRKLNCLKSFRCCSNDISDEMLGNLWKYNQSIENLEISNERISDDGIFSLCHLKNLRFVVLVGLSEITEVSIYQLSCHVKRLNSVYFECCGNVKSSSIKNIRGIECGDDY